MSRYLTDQNAKGHEGEVVIAVIDEPGAGGANHQYVVSAGKDAQLVRFQNGPVKEDGLNGLTHEALLAILIDRLECFQAGDYPSKYNELALVACREALFHLHSRTYDRDNRNVEGTSQQ